MSFRKVPPPPLESYRETKHLVAVTDDAPLLPPPPGVLPGGQKEEDRGGSINVMLATVFLQSIGFTVTLPSMLYFVDSLHAADFYGWIVAIYSVGQFLGSPIFGYWSNHAPTRYSIITSLFISAVGNVMYGFVGFMPGPGWMMLVSRFLVGLGAGNVSVCRAYVSEASSLSQRAGTMVKMSAAQGMGFVVGPVLGYAVSFVHFHLGPIPINAFTSPGFISAILGIGNTIFAAILFKELASRQGADVNQQANADKPSRQELIPMIVSIFLFFVVIVVFSVFETMITLVTSRDFGWTVQDNGILFISVGLLSVVVFIFVSTPYMKKKEDRKMMLFGTTVQIIGLACAANYTWPFHQDRLTQTQFFVAAVIIGIGYPISSAYMFAIYSKVLNPAFQGTKMGWLTAGGSMARMTGPIWATHAFKFGGGEALFLGTDSIVVVSLVVLIIFYRRLGPHPAYFISKAPAVSINDEQSPLIPERGRSYSKFP